MPSPKNRRDAAVVLEIDGHVDRNKGFRPGAHATREQHAAWRSTHREQLREQGARQRAKHRYLDQVRAAALQYIRERDPELCADALAHALANSSEQQRGNGPNRGGG